MASTHKSLRSSTADKRPTTSIADGQIALNTNAASPGLFFKDSAGTDIIKVGPVHVGTTAPNATPATGGSSGNSKGEVWLDTSLTPLGVKIWNGSSWENATPAGSTTVQGLLELATSAETQTGTDTARAVTPAGLQSKVSDSTSTTSSTTIASSTAVKSAYDLANAALPKTGGTITGALEIGTTGSLVFEGATANDYETTVAVTDPTADRTITLPDRSGTVITNADTGTVTSTMIADGTIVNADVNASAAIAGTKISPNFGAQTLVVDTNVLYVDATTDRVGINTSSATFPLQVETTATGTTAGSNGVILVQSQASGRDAHIRFGDSVNSTARVGYLNNNLYAYVNGQERLRIDSSGRLGVGTSSPAATLHSRADNAGTGSTPLLIQNRSISANTAVGISFAPNTSDTADRSAIIYGVNSSGGSGNATDLAFHTNANGGSPSEKARINSSGRLGVGTSAPGALLDVYLGNSVAGTIARFGGYNDGRSLVFSNSGIGNDHYINAQGGAGTITFQTASTDRVRIDSSGLVGIGTSSPSSYNSAFRNLVVANTSGFCGITVASATNSEGTLAFADGTVGSQTYRGYFQYNHTGDYLRIGVNGGEVARFDSLGRLGVGTSSPGRDIDLRKTVPGGVVTLRVRNDDLAANSDAKLELDTPNGVWGIRALRSGGRLAFDLGGSEKAAVDQAGRLLVGTSSTSSTTTAIFQNNSAGSGPGIVRLTRPTDPGNGSALGLIAFGDGGHSSAATIQVVRDGGTWTSGSSQPTRIEFSTTANGASSPTEGLRISSAGELYSVPTWNNTAANSANLFVTSSGNFGRSTSSAKYKTDIETIENSYSDALLNCRPVWYRSTSKLDNPDYGWWGFIAEEVAEIDPRLVFWKTVDITYDEKGSVVETPCEPEPEGVAYDRFVPHLLNLIKRQQQAIETLEAKVAALEGN